MRQAASRAGSLTWSGVSQNVARNHHPCPALLHVSDWSFLDGDGVVPECVGWLHFLHIGDYACEEPGIQSCTYGNRFYQEKALPLIDAACAFPSELTEWAECQ
jgi:hypothetical protein